jgi:uncharacterized protein
MPGLIVTSAGQGVRLTVRVQPRASRAHIDGVRDGVLRVRLTAAPVDGAANAALVELLAETLGVARRAVRIVRGSTARQKLVEIEGIDRQSAERRFAAVTDGDVTSTQG